MRILRNRNELSYKKGAHDSDKMCVDVEGCVPMCNDARGDEKTCKDEERRSLHTLRNGYEKKRMEKLVMV